MENLSTLTGKYGDEGDKLIFKILDSGEFFEKTKSFREYENRLSDIIALTMQQRERHDETKKGVRPEDEARLKPLFEEASKQQGLVEQRILPLFREYLNSKRLASEISEKALRYDLTVPFARYVVQHQNEISFPFKRFQVQPVWRADRPQKGRYREFYQCDADVVGSDSLVNEAEFVLIYDEALTSLGLKDFTIKINNRKILSGIASIINKSDDIISLTVAMDKLDKIGLNGVINELLEKGFTEADIKIIEPIILLQGSNKQKLQSLRKALANSPVGQQGCDEVEQVLNYVAVCKLQTANIELDITLARGLNYYTGAIFEVKTNEIAMGSIGGGGRYDDLTGMFGLKGITGVGISFGADRIYDVLDELGRFPANTGQSTKLLICCFDKDGEKFALPILQQLRKQGINVELYPSGTKIKKQLDYANDKNIPYVIIIGSEEIESGLITIKNMQTGVQVKRTVDQIIGTIKA